MSILAGVVLLVGGLFFAREKNNRAGEENYSPAIAQSEAVGSARPTNDLHQPATPATAVVATESAPLSSVQAQSGEQNSPAQNQAAYTEARTAELMDIAMTDDPANLDTILSELTNRDPEIRKAAREAAVQFGSRDAIPKLIDAANFTDEAKQKAELTEAAEFLKLPSLSEVTAQSDGTQKPRQTAPGSRPVGRRAKRPAPAIAPPQ